MKLHLPKALFTAVMAVFAIGGMAQAMTATTTTGAVTIDTSQTYNGVNYTYANGTLTMASGYTPSLFEATITLDFDQFLAANDNTSILYIDTTGNIWGYATKKETTTDESTGESATAVTVQGRWPDATSAYTDGNPDVMPATTLANLATGEGENQVIEGLKVALQSGSPGVSLTTADGTKVYYNSGLTQGGKTIESVEINSTLVTSLTVTDITSQSFANADGTWQKTFEGNTVTNITGGKVRLTGGENGSVKANVTPIVVGGAGYLHLEAFEMGTVNLDDDIYMGSSTYNASAQENVADYGVIRISNDGAFDANLSGSIYLVEDSSIKGTGTKAINISGTVTDKGVPTNNGTVDGNYTLTLGGAGFVLSGDIDVYGLSLVQGYSSSYQYFTGTMTISGTANVDTLSVGENTTLTVTGDLTVGSTVSNAGSIDLSGGTVSIEDLTTDNYTALSTFYSKADKSATAANGYAYTDKVILMSGTVTTDDTTSITGEGLASWSYVDGTGIVGTLTDAVYDTDTFYVNSGTVRIAKTAASSDGVVYSDNSASTFVVGNGATLDVYFKSDDQPNANDYAMVGKNIQLKSGATLTNTGGNGSLQRQLLKSVELLGNATVEATTGNNYGFQGSNAGATTLNLNGHTLEKTGAGEFWLLNTTVTAGTIKITGGSVKVINKSSTAADTDFVLNGSSASLTVTANQTLTAKSVSGTGTINGGGILDTAALTLDGTMKLTAGKIITDALTVSGGTLTMSTGTVLDAREATPVLKGNGDNNTDYLNQLLTKLAAVTTEGTSYVLAKGTANDNYDNDNGTIHLRANATLTCNLVLTDNLGINGRASNGQNPPFSLTVAEGASLKVGETGTGRLSLVTGTSLIMEAGSSVTAGDVILGHHAGNNPATDTGNAGRYHGKISMSGEKSKLTVDKITFKGSSDNALTVTGGEVEFTNAGNITTSIVAAADNNDRGAVDISDAKLTANNSWALSSDSANVTVALEDVTFNVAAEKTVTLGGSQVKLAGDNTVTGAGKLVIAGELGTTLTDASTSVSVDSGATMSWKNDSVTVQALGEETDAKVTTAAIDAAKVSVDTTKTTGVQAITGGSDLTITGGATLTLAGDSSLSALTIGNTYALSVTGALTLTDGATINLTGLQLNAEQTSYTLATATNGITLQSYTITGLDLTGTAFEGYEYTLSPGNGGVMPTDESGAPAALVLTFTAPDKEELIGFNITGGTYADNVLTFTTDADLTGKMFGDTVDATMTDAVWEQILASTTLPPDVLVSFTDAAGEIIDFDGDGTAQEPTITINGEGAKDGNQVLTGDGTIVGNYVTAYIPEPTTTTLSLLALAGLAVRRRRASR